MRLKNGFLAIVLCMMIPGCGSTDVIMKKQMETDAKMEKLVQENMVLNAQLADLTKEVNDLHDKVRANSEDLGEIKPAVSKMTDTAESLPAKKEPDIIPNAVPRIEVVNKDTSPSDKESMAQNAYMKAFGLFSANNYPAAIDAFGSFIKTYSDSEYAGNAAYWIGECHYTQHDYPKAVTAFNKVLSGYPKGSKVPDAMLKIGYSHISMNEPVKAKAILQTLIDKYPNSQAAVKARERLNRN
jgi:tol-pal system protein YbgF